MRELNTYLIAKNLKDLAASSAVLACCPGSSGQDFNLDETIGWAGTEHQIGPMS